MDIQDCAVEQMKRYNRHPIFVVTFDISVSNAFYSYWEINLKNK